MKEKPWGVGGRCSMLEEILGFGVLVLTVVGLLGVTVWLCCSVAENIIKMRQRAKDARYTTLSKENEHLKALLVKVEEENFHLREILSSKRLYHESTAGQNATLLISEF
jgi:hypothetical protein